MELDFLYVIDLIGTFVFAISGIRLASGKDIDWFGAYIVGLVTAIGGGTLRDLLLDNTPFWMEDAKYVLVTGAGLVAALLFKDRLFRWGKTLFLFDTIGLGMFCIVGVVKSYDAGFPFWVCIIMGTITGSVGGVIRDLILNEIPLLFRRDIYATACIAGGFVYFACIQFPSLLSYAEFISAGTVIVTRILAVRYHLHFPVLKSL